jgi:hypothetical protein
VKKLNNFKENKNKQNKNKDFKEVRAVNDVEVVTRLILRNVKSLLERSLVIGIEIHQKKLLTLELLQDIHLVTPTMNSLCERV